MTKAYSKISHSNKHIWTLELGAKCCHHQRNTRALQHRTCAWCQYAWC